VSDDSPRLSADCVARPADVEHAREDATARAALDEDLRQEAVTLAGQRAEQVRPIALANDDAGDALWHDNGEKLGCRRAIGIGRDQCEPRCLVCRRYRCLDGAQKRLDAQVFVSWRSGSGLLRTG
jgi:hypothetical protein